MGISKLEDKKFRFTRIDVKKVDESIEISRNDYAKRLEMIVGRDRRPHKELTRE